MKGQFIFLLIVLFGCAACSSFGASRIVIIPPENGADCIGGYVIFSLTVKAHKAVNPKIVKSLPEGVFDKHVMKTIPYIYFDYPDGTFIPEFRIKYEPDDYCEEGGSVSRPLADG